MGWSVFPIGKATKQMSDKPLRFVHMSDMHVEPDPLEGPFRQSEKGFVRALTLAHALNPKPDFIVTGGDHIMDALERDEISVDAQWEVYRHALNEHCTLPVFPVIGNHDIFGWMTEKVDVNHPLYGKQQPMERLGMMNPYYSFDRGAWHFVVLDNSQRGGRGYYGGIDPPQLEWLKADLEGVPAGRPICVISHIPILSICAQQFFGPNAGITFWQIPDVFVMMDSRSVTDLFAKYNVKLCISAHIHMIDRIEYAGITYITDGAVSGNWWKGPFHDVAEGFGVFDLWPDGTFDFNYHPLGWKARE